MTIKYEKNKEHIYKWRKQNNEEYKIIQMRCYYKKKIQCPIWREVKYEFLDILI